MQTTELLVSSLISGFVTGAHMLIEVMKQNPWFLLVVIFCTLIPTKRPKKH